MKPMALYLAVAALFGSAGAALANPTGPEVVHGTVSFAAAGKTLVVAPTAGAIINWRGFSIAPDEITRFVQPAASSTVLNRIGSGEFGVFGRLESNGRLLFMQSGRVFGEGVPLDLAGINIAALRQPLPAHATAREVEFRAAGSAGRSVDPWVVIIVPESVPVAAGGGMLLPSGVSAELADARWPHVHVRVTAPAGQPFDVAQLLRKSGALGIFASLLAVPRARSAGGADEPLQLASTEVTPPIVAPPALPAAAPVADQRMQVALHDEMPVPAPMPLAAGDDAMGAPVTARVIADARSSLVPVAMGDDDSMTRVRALAEAPIITTAEPVILAAVQTRTMYDAAVAEHTAATLEAQPAAIAEVQAAPVLPVDAPAASALAEPVAAAPQAVPEPTVPAMPTVTAEPAAAPSATVVVASAEASYRRVALVASDTPVWPAPVRLERVERRMPVIMFDRKGGIFHL